MTPAAPGEARPVPPFAAGTTPSEIVGVVVGFDTAMGLVALTELTLPEPGSPLWATIVQSSPSTGATATLPRSARHEEPPKLTPSSTTYGVARVQAPRQFLARPGRPLPCQRDDGTTPREPGPEPLRLLLPLGLHRGRAARLPDLGLLHLEVTAEPAEIVVAGLPVRRPQAAHGKDQHGH